MNVYAHEHNNFLENATALGERRLVLHNYIFGFVLYKLIEPFLVTDSLNFSNTKPPM